MLREWAATIVQATKDAEEQLARETMVGVPHEGAEELFDVARWLAQQVRLGTLHGEFRLLSHSRETLAVIERATHSLVFGETSAGVPLAAELVEDHAAHHRRTTRQQAKAEYPAHLRVPRDHHASALIVRLERSVHPGFGALREAVEDVVALLDRYEPDPQRRRRAGGKDNSGLSADGILERLNDLSGRPLGAGHLNADAIRKARRRAEPPPD